MTITEIIPNDTDNIEYIFKQLGITEKEYFLTGSRALDNEELNYKISNDNSDIDYVVLIIKRHSIINWLVENKIEIEGSCYNGGFKFKYKGKIYNIITTIFIEFSAWKEALHILKYLITIDEKYRKVIADKMSRYCAYETLRGFIKTFLTLSERL